MIFRDIYQSGFQHHTHCGEYVMCTALSDSFKAVIAKSCILMNDISRYLSVPFSTSHWLWRIRCVYCPLWSCQGCNIKITAFSCWTIFRDIYQSHLQHHANCGEYVVCTALSDRVMTVISKSLQSAVERYCEISISPVFKVTLPEETMFCIPAPLTLSRL